MEMLSGAQMVIRTLEDLGVDKIFGYPGGGVLHIYDALLESSKIKHILAVFCKNNGESKERHRKYFRHF